MSSATASTNPHETKGPTSVILAGVTGDLGNRIADYLLQDGIKVTALVRKSSDVGKLTTLIERGLKVVEVDFEDRQKLANACTGGDCLVSALSGLEDVIIGVQSRLLEAAITAGVPRFIPSDFCIDYAPLAEGSNRNLDFRRTFNRQLDKSPIAATSILNGMFTDLLTGQAPVVLSGISRVLYWGDANQLLDFTTIDDTARYTAFAAADATTPRYLRIAGDVKNAHGLKEAATKATGKQHHLLRAGGLSFLKTMIKITRYFKPGKKEVFPPWQGMQYMHNMFTGLPKLSPLDNDRYSDMHFTSVQDVLAAHAK